MCVLIIIFIYSLRVTLARFSLNRTVHHRIHSSFANLVTFYFNALLCFKANMKITLKEHEFRVAFFLLYLLNMTTQWGVKVYVANLFIADDDAFKY